MKKPINEETKKSPIQKVEGSPTKQKATSAAIPIKPIDFPTAGQRTGFLVRSNCQIVLKVLTDKPVYQCGDTAFVQIFFIDAISHRFKLPNINADLRQISFCISNSRSIDIHKETILAKDITVENYSMVLTWKIPPETSGGIYYAKIKPSTAYSFKEAWRVFRVRKYFKKPMSITMELDKKSYFAGDSIYASLSIRKSDGKPIPPESKLIYTAKFGSEATVKGEGYPEANGKALLNIRIPEDIEIDGMLKVQVMIPREEAAIITKAIILDVKQEVQIEFVPETGHIHPGFPTTMYYMAKTGTGVLTEVTANLISRPTVAPLPIVPIATAKSGAKKIICEASTLHQGKGKFQFTPNPKNSYYLVVLFSNGKSQELKLPSDISLSKHSVNFHVDNPIWNHREDLKVTIYSDITDKPLCTRLMFKNKEKEIFGMNAMIKTNPRNVELVSKEVSIRAASVFPYLPNGGVISLTLVVTDPSSKGKGKVKKIQILGERLLFLLPIRIFDIQMNMGTNLPDGAQFSPGDPLQLQFSLHGNRPDINELDKYMNIRVIHSAPFTEVGKEKLPPSFPTAMLLENEILKDNSEREFLYSNDYLQEIYDPQNKFKSSTQLDSPTLLDLLLGVQNWRRYIFLEGSLGDKSRAPSLPENMKAQYNVLNSGIMDEIDDYESEDEYMYYDHRSEMEKYGIRRGPRRVEKTSQKEVKVYSESHTEYVPAYKHEIIQVQAGQCGNQMANRFLDIILGEHEVDASGTPKSLNPKFPAKESDLLLERIHTYFSEEPTGAFKQRTVLVDTDTSVVDRLITGKTASLFKIANIITGNGGCGNNWGKGFYTDGAELMDEIIDCVRKEAEGCHSLQGFQLCHSMGGGTGSGLGSLFMTKIRDEYPDKILASFSVVPSEKISDVVVEPYNATFTFHNMIENTDCTFLFDNEALYRIGRQNPRGAGSAFASLNELIANSISSTTCSFRFPSLTNTDLRKMNVNLVPFPRLHFYTMCYAPIISTYSPLYHPLPTAELTSLLFNPLCCVSGGNPLHGRWMTALALYRGQMGSSEVEDSLIEAQRTRSSYFIEWVPNNFEYSVSDIPTYQQKRSCLMLGNSTSIQEVYKRVGEKFTAMFRRNAFVHWYTGEGMDQMEFTEAESNLNDLVSEYQQYQDATCEEEGEYDEEEEEEDGGGGECEEDEEDEEEAGRGGEKAAEEVKELPPPVISPPEEMKEDLEEEGEEVIFEKEFMIVSKNTTNYAHKRREDFDPCVREDFTQTIYFSNAVALGPKTVNLFDNHQMYY